MPEDPFSASRNLKSSINTQTQEEPTKENKQDVIATIAEEKLENHKLPITFEFSISDQERATKIRIYLCLLSQIFMV